MCPPPNPFPPLDFDSRSAPRAERTQQTRHGRASQRAGVKAWEPKRTVTSRRHNPTPWSTRRSEGAHKYRAAFTRWRRSTEPITALNERAALVTRTQGRVCLLSVTARGKGVASVLAFLLCRKEARYLRKRSWYAEETQQHCEHGVCEQFTVQSRRFFAQGYSPKPSSLLCCWALWLRAIPTPAEKR